MPTNASPGLITALIASLANPAHGWAVTNVAETASTRLSAVTVTGSVTGTVTGTTSGIIEAGEGSVTGSTTGAVTGSTSSTNASITTDTMTVTLVAAHLLESGGTPRQLTYVSIKVDGGFASAKIKQAGAELVSTSSPLDSAIRTLASAFLSARDAELAGVFGGAASAGAITATTAASGDLVAALKASLVDEDALWSVQGGTTNTIKEPKQGSPDEPIQMVVARIEQSLTVGSPYVRVGVGEWGPLVFCYTATLDPSGAYQSAMLYIDGKAYTTTDSALHTQLMAIAAAAWADSDQALTASLEHGPQTNAEIQNMIDGA